MPTSPTLQIQISADAIEELETLLTNVTQRMSTQDQTARKLLFLKREISTAAMKKNYVARTLKEIQSAD